MRRKLLNLQHQLCRKGCHMQLWLRKPVPQAKPFENTNLIEKTSASCIEQSIMSSKRLQKTKDEALGKRTSTVQTVQDRICAPEVPGIGSSI